MLKGKELGKLAAFLETVPYIADSGVSDVDIFNEWNNLIKDMGRGNVIHLNIYGDVECEDKYDRATESAKNQVKEYYDGNVGISDDEYHEDDPYFYLNEWFDICSFSVTHENLCPISFEFLAYHFAKCYKQLGLYCANLALNDAIAKHVKKGFKR